MQSNPDHILKELLPLVAFDGWTNFAFNQAVKRAKLDAGAAMRAFPKGVDECMDYFFARQDELLAQAFPEGTLKHMRMPERIETLLNWRLEKLLPYREAVRRAVAKRAMPWNAVKATVSLYKSVDLMWRLAGDTSTDFSFYTKRMTLAAIYSSALLYWLSDTSEHYSNTRAFIQRRLNDVASFGKWKKESKASLQKLISW